MTTSRFIGVVYKGEYRLPRLEDQLEADLATLKIQCLLLYSHRQNESFVAYSLRSIVRPGVDKTLL